MKRLIGLLLPLALLAGERAGPYLGAGAGIANYRDDGRLASIEGTDETRYHFNAGAFINKYFSVEFALAHFNDFGGIDRDGVSVRESFNTLTADALVHYPVMNDRLDFFGKFGAGQIFWEEHGSHYRSSNSATLLFGAGFGFRPTKRVTVNIGYDFNTFRMDVNTTRFEMQLGTGYLEVQVQF